MGEGLLQATEIYETKEQIIIPSHEELYTSESQQKPIQTMRTEESLGERPPELKLNVLDLDKWDSQVQSSLYYNTELE